MVIAATPTFRTDAFIDGSFRPALSGARFVTENPATGKPLAEIAAGDSADIDLAVQAARRAFDDGRWSRRSSADRKLVLLRFADLLEANLDELAVLDSARGRQADHRLPRRRPARDGSSTFRWYAEAIDKLFDAVGTDRTRRLGADPARADRGRGGRRALELPDPDGGLEGRHRHVAAGNSHGRQAVAS